MITLRLSLMMFLQFFIWGGWFVTLGTYLSNTLSANGGQIGMAFSTQSWGAIIAPFIVGLIAELLTDSLMQKRSSAYYTLLAPCLCTVCTKRMISPAFTLMCWHT